MNFSGRKSPRVYDSSLAAKSLWYAIAVFTVVLANFPVEKVSAAHRPLIASLSVSEVDASVYGVATSLCSSEGITSSPGAEFN